MPAILRVFFGDLEAVSEGEIPSQALRRPLGKPDVIRQLSKTNDTPFVFEELDGTLEEELFLPMGALNSLRRDALEQLRDVLSRGRAQQRYLKSRITSLNASLSRFMRLTGMPFSLRLDADELAFVFVTPEGYEHPACHLSGAQQSMSALALQMALFDTIGPNMNLYLIDEPAEALDDENKLVMAEMFARMNRMLPSVDGTMLIVTRDRPIMDACGNVLDVTQGR